MKASGVVYGSVKKANEKPAGETGCRIEPGSLVPEQRMVSTKGSVIDLTQFDDRFIHLQFRRFAGCPVCNLHLQSFVHQYEKLKKAGVREVVVFHSPAEDLLIHEGHLPFDLIADPSRRLYALFGVESSPRSLLNPKAWLPIVRGIFHSLKAVLRKDIVMPPVMPQGGSLGLPADFVIADQGRVVACKYGVHANDQWSVDEVLDLAVQKKTCFHLSFPIIG